MNSLIKLVAFAMWGLAVGTVSYNIYMLDAYSVTNGSERPIAKISYVKGKVKFRPKENINWYGAIIDQGLREGDMVSTGPSSVTFLKFNTGEELKVDEGSQIEVSTLGNGSSLNIRLLKGFVFASTSKKTKLTITSGKKKFKLSGKGDELCLSKEIGKDGNVLCQKKSGKVLKAKPELAVLGSLKEVEKIQPKIIEAPPLSISAEGTSPSILSPKPGAVAWTTKKLNDKRLYWNIKVSKPKKNPKIGKWSPFLDLFPSINTYEHHRFQGKPLKRSQSIRVAVAPLMLSAQEMREVPPTELEIKATAGGALFDKKTKDEDEELSTSEITYTLKSFAQLGSGPIEVGVLGIETSRKPGTWVMQKRTLTPKTAKFRIRFKNKRLFLAALPLLQNGSFYVKNVSTLNGFRTYVAKSMEMISSISGKMSKKDADRLRKLLDADFIYNGSQSPYFDARSKSITQFKGWINKNMSSNRSVFVMRKGKFYPISRSFLRNKDQVLRFVGRNAKYVFDKKVQIISSKY